MLEQVMDLNSESVQPFLSIITVTKNCAATIARTLESIRAIKTPDIQYLVIDGVSSDGTLFIVQGFNTLVDRLISERDIGIYNAMNKGIELATGQYILFINGDDHIIKEGFDKALEILRKEKPTILSCRSQVALDDSVHIGMLRPQPYFLPFFNSVPHPSTFVSAKILKSIMFREDLKIASDYDLFLRLFLRRYRFRVEDLVTAVHYRGGASSDVQVSISEIESIKKKNLGLFYYSIVRMIQLTYRLIKCFVFK